MDSDEEVVCPLCCSTNVAGILWGLPVFNDELQRELDAKRIVLGGCDISDDDPVWHCNECGHRWGHLTLPESVAIPVPWRALLILALCVALVSGLLIGIPFYLHIMNK